MLMRPSPQLRRSRTARTCSTTLSPCRRGSPQAARIYKPPFAWYEYVFSNLPYYLLCTTYVLLPYDAGNEKIAAKAAAKIAARQAGVVPELLPAPEFYFFHPSKGMIDKPFSA